MFVDRNESCIEMSEKLDFLYEIGFIGVTPSEELGKRLKLLNHDLFWFSEKNEGYETLKDDSFEHCKFIIHPIFCEFLSLNTINQKLTINIDWNFLYSQESHVILPS